MYFPHIVIATIGLWLISIFSVSHAQSMTLESRPINDGEDSFFLTARIDFDDEGGAWIMTSTDYMILTFISSWTPEYRQVTLHVFAEPDGNEARLICNMSRTSLGPIINPDWLVNPQTLSTIKSLQIFIGLYLLEPVFINPTSLTAQFQYINRIISQPLPQLNHTQGSAIHQSTQLGAYRQLIKQVIIPRLFYESFGSAHMWERYDVASTSANGKHPIYKPSSLLIYLENFSPPTKSETNSENQKWVLFLQLNSQVEVRHNFPNSTAESSSSSSSSSPGDNASRIAEDQSITCYANQIPLEAQISQISLQSHAFVINFESDNFLERVDLYNIGSFLIECPGTFIDNPTHLDIFFTLYTAIITYDSASLSQQSLQPVHRTSLVPASTSYPLFISSQLFDQHSFVFSQSQTALAEANNVSLPQYTLCSAFSNSLEVLTSPKPSPSFSIQHFAFSSPNIMTIAGTLQFTSNPPNSTDSLLFCNLEEASVVTLNLTQIINFEFSEIPNTVFHGSRTTRSGEDPFNVVSSPASPHTQFAVQGTPAQEYSCVTFQPYKQHFRTIGQVTTFIFVAQFALTSRTTQQSANNILSSPAHRHIGGGSSNDTANGVFNPQPYNLPVSSLADIAYHIKGSYAHRGVIYSDPYYLGALIPTNRVSIFVTQPEYFEQNQVNNNYQSIIPRVHLVSPQSRQTAPTAQTATIGDFMQNSIITSLLSTSRVKSLLSTLLTTAFTFVPRNSIINSFANLHSLQPQPSSQLTQSSSQPNFFLRNVKVYRAAMPSLFTSLTISPSSSSPSQPRTIAYSQISLQSLGNHVIAPIQDSARAIPSSSSLNVSSPFLTASPEVINSTSCSLQIGHTSNIVEQTVTATYNSTTNIATIAVAGELSSVTPTIFNLTCPDMFIVSPGYDTFVAQSKLSLSFHVSSLSPAAIETDTSLTMASSGYLSYTEEYTVLGSSASPLQNIQWLSVFILGLLLTIIAGCLTFLLFVFAVVTMCRMNDYYRQYYIWLARYQPGGGPAATEEWFGASATTASSSLLNEMQQSASPDTKLTTDAPATVTVPGQQPFTNQLPAPHTNNNSNPNHPLPKRNQGRIAGGLVPSTQDTSSTVTPLVFANPVHKKQPKQAFKSKLNNYNDFM